jgi:hypothetical protein
MSRSGLLRLFGLAVLMSATPSAFAFTAHSASKVPVYCEYPNKYYPGLCQGKQAATNECARGVTENNEFPADLPKGSYVAGSSSRYRVSVFEETDRGCHFVGHRVVMVSQQRREGPSGTFVRSSSPITLRGDGVIRFHDVLNVSYSCASPTAAGSAVRVDVHIRWIPDRGFGRLPKTAQDGTTPIKWDAYSKTEPIC